MLTGGPRDAPERQRTLRQAIAWSYDLLDPGEQSLYSALGVFVGGCTFAGAEAVVAAIGDVDVFAGLGSLLDKNLLVLDASGFEPRVATFARYCDGLIAVDRGEGERAAMALQDALTRFEALGDTLFATVCLNALGRNASVQGDSLSSLSFFERTLALYDLRQDKYGRAIALVNLSASHCNLGHHEQAQDFATQALALAGEVGVPYRKAAALDVLYELALDRREIPRAAVLCQEALGLWWDMAEMWHVASDTSERNCFLNGPNSGTNCFVNAGRPMAVSATAAGRLAPIPASTREGLLP